MNYCPDCGAQVEYDRTEETTVLTCTYWRCPRCTAAWIESVVASTSEVLQIIPVKGGD